ncbi:hypothetical protein CQ14_12400 [Bradyrhizobium lablabi]|uniref:Uncharacterized protein n=1 Tax=Bradyrhizobium lablabi TaxID=722472 RepID=A0A0R3MKG3_9BRAD|nr:hypothetical protein [Bradyrhizobium lablabi]KRR17190.1 hypothetical protein CQ14_12400 [Bradyrhizobium lablabi]
MKRFFRRLTASLRQDDLFERVVFVLTGLLFGGLGVALLAFLSTDASASRMAKVFLWPLAVLLTSAGGLMAARCALPAQSRLARCLDSNLPDAGWLEENVFLIVVIYLPAILLTLLMRRLGIRGQRMAESAQ